jgi:hypothetical protein
MRAVADMLAGIKSGKLLPDSLFASLEADAALDRRDRPKFGERWMAAFEKMEAAWKKPHATADNVRLVTRLREAAFKRAFRASGDHHDLAATISDDFDLIARKKLLSLEDPFIDQLEQAYLAHRLPT